MDAFTIRTNNSHPSIRVEIVESSNKKSSCRKLFFVHSRSSCVRRNIYTHVFILYYNKNTHIKIVCNLFFEMLASPESYKSRGCLTAISKDRIVIAYGAPKKKNVKLFLSARMHDAEKRGARIECELSTHSTSLFLDFSLFAARWNMRNDQLAQRNALNTKLIHNYETAKVMKNEFSFVSSVWQCERMAKYEFIVHCSCISFTSARVELTHKLHLKRLRGLRQLFARHINIRR